MLVLLLLILVGAINFIDRWGGKKALANNVIAHCSVLFQFQLIKSNPVICCNRKVSVPAKDSSHCERKRKHD